MKKILNGIDNVANALPYLNGKRVGLITNNSGTNKQLKPTYEILGEICNVTCLFAPEHGLKGAAQAGKHVENENDGSIGLPIYDLYGETKAPNDEMLKNVDVLCFDIQDVGARFYTYLYTMTRSMKAAARAGIPFVVFDRFNPISLSKVEGELLDESNASFIGEYAIPTRYGLTIGEFARYCNSEKNIGVELHVVECCGIKREMYFRDTDLPWIAPSPNMPSPECALVYPATCIYESVLNVSEGRGTTQPFEMIGSPEFNGKRIADEMNAKKLGGVIFRPVYFTPTFSKFEKQLCQGVQIHVTDREAYSSFEVCVNLFSLLRENYELNINEKGNLRCFGTNRLYKGTPVDELISVAAKTSEQFRKQSEKYMLY